MTIESVFIELGEAVVTVGWKIKRHSGVIEEFGLQNYIRGGDTEAAVAECLKNMLTDFMDVVAEDARQSDGRPNPGRNDCKTCCGPSSPAASS